MSKVHRVPLPSTQPVTSHCVIAEPNYCRSAASGVAKTGALHGLFVLPNIASFMAFTEALLRHPTSSTRHGPFTDPQKRPQSSVVHTIASSGGRGAATHISKSLTGCQVSMMTLLEWAVGLG